MGDGVKGGRDVAGERRGHHNATRYIWGVIQGGLPRVGTARDCSVCVMEGPASGHLIHAPGCSLS